MEIVTFGALSDTLLVEVFFLSLSTLYANALLALLNARPLMNRKLENDSVDFQYPESDVPRRRTQIVCDRASRSIDDVMEFGSSRSSKAVTLEMDPGNVLFSDNASSIRPSEKINRI